MAEFEGATDDFVDASRVWVNQNDHAAIVIHGTGGNPNQTDTQLGAFFETTPARTSVHYGIDRTGAIAQYVLEKDGAGGNGILDPGHDPFWDQYAENPNWHSLSVETENDLTNSLPLTDPQKQTLFRLIKYWVDKYGIPLSNIKGHFSLEPVNRVDCPGQQFPWDELWTYLKGEETMTIDLTNGTVASHFEGGPDVWKCKSNGFFVGYGILGFYKRFGGDGLCGLTYAGLPKGNEEAIPGHPGVVKQEFERVTLYYDPNHEIDNPPGSGDVYVAHSEQASPDQALVSTLKALIPQLVGVTTAIGTLP